MVPDIWRSALPARQAARVQAAAHTIPPAALAARNRRQRIRLVPARNAA
jgi:hypothetical protein